MIDNSELSVFTTALLRNGEIQWLDEHLFRLAKHALALGIPHPGDAVLREQVRLVARETSVLSPPLEKGNFAQSRDISTVCLPQLIRIALSQNGHDVTTRPVAAIPDNVYDGAKLVVTKIQVDPQLAHLKTNHQSPYQAARQIAVQHDAFEGLLIDANGFVVDGSRSSPLLFRDNTLISLEGGLRGITREKVLERAIALGLPTCRLRLKPEQLRGVLLVAGSGIGLVPGALVHDQRITTLVKEFRII